MKLLEKLNTLATVKENEEAKGIEVYFNTKPEYNIITELKNNKFRWHKVKKCWYIKKSMLNETTKKEVKEVKEMKEFTKVVGEELRDLAKKLWDSESMQDYLIDKYDFYKTKDGLIIELEKVNKITMIIKSKEKLRNSLRI